MRKELHQCGGHFLEQLNVVHALHFGALLLRRHGTHGFNYLLLLTSGARVPALELVPLSSACGHLNAFVLFSAEGIFANQFLEFPQSKIHFVP
jgi:hypothetical protein